MQKPIYLVAGDQASIPSVNRVLSPKKLWMFFVCQQNFSEKRTFFFDRLKRLLVVQILEVTVYQENAEHTRLINFHWQSEKVKMGGTCLGEHRYSKTIYSTLANCTTIQRTPSQGNVSRHLPTFEGMKKFYYRHSAKKCIKYSFDSRVHQKTECRLCFQPPPIALKPGCSPLDRPALDNMTIQPWSDVNYHRRTSDIAYFPFVTLF